MRGPTLTRRQAILAGGLAALSLAGCAAPREGTPHVVMLDSGVTLHPALDAFAITREGPAASTPHGTQVASLILGATGVGRRLDAGRARLTSINIAEDGAPSIDALLRGLDRAATLKADLVNISSGVRHPVDALHEAVDHARARGVLVVASAGNAPFLAPDFPARYESALAVGSEAPDGVPPVGVDVTERGTDLPVLGLDGVVTNQSGASLATALASNRILGLLADGAIDSALDYPVRR